jgi:hypothetical protein
LVFSKVGYVIFYLTLSVVLLFVAPLFGEFVDDGGNTVEVGDVPGATFDPLSLFGRFAILFTISSTNIFVGTVLTILTLGFIWIIIEMIRGN